MLLRQVEIDYVPNPLLSRLSNIGLKTLPFLPILGSMR